MQTERFTAALLAGALLLLGCGASPPPSATPTVGHLGGGADAAPFLAPAPRPDPDVIERAVIASDLPSRPEFHGLTARQIAERAKGNVEVVHRADRRESDVVVTGLEPAQMIAIANAIAEDLCEQSQRARAQHRAELEELIAQSNTRIRLAEVDIRSRFDTHTGPPVKAARPWPVVRNTRERFSKLRDEEQAALIAQEPTYKEFTAVLDDPETSVESLYTHPLVVADNDVVRLIRRVRATAEGSPERAEQEAELEDHVTTLVRGFLVRFELRRENLVRYVNEIDNATAELRRAATIKAMIDERSAQIDRHKADKASAEHALEELNRLDAEGRPATWVIRRAEQRDE